MKDDRAKQELVRAANDWDRAMVENDAETIGRVERWSCVFVRQEGSWRCVLTHLSRLAQEADRS
jgi:hypothetical protein